MLFIQIFKHRDHVLQFLQGKIRKKNIHQKSFVHDIKIKA